MTEEVTDVDLVQSQIRIAAGADPRRPRPVAGHDPRSRGAALQCRITTEDPANGFRPDTGVITAYRTPGRRRHPARRRHLRRCRDRRPLRLDAGQAHLPRPRLRQAVARARRALAEFRIRGVAQHPVPAGASLRDPDFRAGRVTTSFIDERPRAADGRDAPPTAAPSILRLPGRRHGQQAARRRAHHGRTRATSCPTIDLSPRRRAASGRSCSSSVPRGTRGRCASSPRWA